MSEENFSRRPLKTRGKLWVGQLTTVLLRTPVQPDHISLLGVVFAGMAAVFLWISRKDPAAVYFFLAAVCIQLRLLCNMMDGMMAVEGKRKSKLGDVFNEMPDRYEDIIILAAAGFAAFEPALGWAAAAMAILTAYVRAFGASLGTRQFFCGPMAKPHRMFVVTLACLGEAFLPQYGDWLVWGLWIIIAGCLVTVVRRQILVVTEILKQ